MTGDDLYRGTAKGAEGHAPGIAFGKAKEEEMHTEVQWQDGEIQKHNFFFDPPHLIKIIRNCLQSGKL